MGSVGTEADNPRKLAVRVGRGLCNVQLPSKQPSVLLKSCYAPTPRFDLGVGGLLDVGEQSGLEIWRAAMHLQCRLQLVSKSLAGPQHKADGSGCCRLRLEHTPTASRLVP